MWTELVKGETLEQLVLSGGPQPVEDVISIGRTLCHAAAVVHQVGLVHPQITARNVVRDASGRVVLIEPMSRVPGDRTAGEVVSDICKLISFLATARADATMRELAISGPLAAVIERATSTEPGRGIATLDALELALTRAVTPGANASHETRVRRLWRAITAWTDERIGGQRR
jgi:hypothetical protein